MTQHEREPYHELEGHKATKQGDTAPSRLAALPSFAGTGWLRPDRYARTRWLMYPIHTSGACVTMVLPNEPTAGNDTQLRLRDQQGISAFEVRPHLAVVV